MINFNPSVKIIVNDERIIVGMLAQLFRRVVGV